MPESVSILIANHNSFEAIQLCVESIRALTTYEDYRIVVLDDNSRNDEDTAYLRDAHDRGWIELIEDRTPEKDRVILPNRVNHPAVFWHGRSLNLLIHSCITRYAMIIDCDVQIRDGTWLSDIVAIAESNDKNLGVANITPKHMHPSDGYVLPEYQTFFLFLDMEKYWDGMQVNWIPHKWERKQEPFQSLFSVWYPPESIDYFQKHCKPHLFDRESVYGDPGTPLWLKVQYDNPRNYKVAEVPIKTTQKYRHYFHASIFGDEFIDEGNPDARFEMGKFQQIKIELAKLREHK